MSTGLVLLLLTLCVLLSAFFSASEMSLSAASRVRLEHLAENGNRKARVALKVLDRFDSALSAILIGNNLVNIAASSLGAIIAIRLMGAGYTWVSTLILTVVVIIVGETVPKILAERNATRFALRLSGPVRALMLVLRPLTAASVGFVRLITKPLKGEDESGGDLSAEELHSIIETAEDEDVLDEDTSDLMNAAIDFSDVTAQEVMTARVDLVTLSLQDSEEEIRAQILGAAVTRLPVYEDNVDHILGILHVNHYLKALAAGKGEGSVDIRELLLPVTYVYKSMKLPAVLEQLQSERMQIAVVTDEYGGTLGIVSVEDIMEELVGEIWDETDTVETEIVKEADGSLTIDGDVLLGDLLEEIMRPEDAGDFVSDTAGGWCMEVLGTFPEAGASFTFGDWLFTVLETGERRVLKIKAEKKNT